MMSNKDSAIKKITVMPKEQVAKLLIFMAGMEAERTICENFCSISERESSARYSYYKRGSELQRGR